MKIFLLLLCSITLSSMVFAQNNLEDVIYLKNGSIIRGVIIEQIPNTSVKIKTADKNIFNFNLTEIEKFTKEETVIKSKGSQFKFKQTGFRNFTELGFLVGAGNINSLVAIGAAYRNHIKAYSLSTVNGFLINPNVFVGIGIGIEKVTIDYGWPEYLDTRVGHFIPLYLDTRFYLLKKQVTQFFYTDMGYSWGRNVGESGSDWAGVMGSAGTGVVYRFTKVNALSLSVGFKIQQIKLKWIQTYIYPYEQFTVQYYEKSFSYFIVIKIGISF